MTNYTDVPGYFLSRVVDAVLVLYATGTVYRDIIT